MTTDYPKKKKFNCKPKGRRNIGRPETRWGDDFREEGTGLIDVDDDDCILYVVCSLLINIKILGRYE